MRETTIKIRASKEEKELVAKLATKRGLDISNYLRYLITKDQLALEGK